MKLAILITSFNRKNITLRCLSKLFSSILPEDLLMQVYLVDDGSSDGTGETVGRHFQNIKVIKGDGKLYWGGGTNKAWINASKEYDFDYYVWLNDDVELFDNTLNTLIKCSKILQDFGIISASMQEKASNKITYGGIKKGSKGNLIPSGKIQECETVNGNCVLIPRFVYNKVGMLDPIFIHAMGDLDYGTRAQKMGVKCYKSPDIGGYCELNTKIPNWNRANLSLIDRLISLYSISSYNQPIKYFIYARRRFGVVIAFTHVVKMHLKLFFPTQ